MPLIDLCELLITRTGKINACAARPQATTAEIKKKASVFASPLRCVDAGIAKFFKLKVEILTN